MLSEPSRYLAVTVSGLVIDLTIARGVATVLALPVAAAVGLSIAAVYSYIMHEFWTFRAQDSRVSTRRVAAYAANVVLVGVIRVGIIALIDLLFSGKFGKLATLIVAAGISFVANYVISKKFIYIRSKPGS